MSEILAAYHAFLYSEKGMADLGTFGGNQSGALASNTSGQIVGFSTTGDGQVHAFLYSDGQMRDLNAISDLSASNFQILSVGKAINDLGFIAGDGIAADGNKHAFLLTPKERAVVRRSEVPSVEAPVGQWTYVHQNWVWVHRTVAGGGKVEIGAGMAPARRLIITRILRRPRRLLLQLARRRHHLLRLAFRQRHRRRRW